MDNTLSKDDTRVLKGIAIVLMLITHLWESPGRICGGALNHLFTIGYTPLHQYIGAFGNICVSFFFFLGGYGLYKTYNDKPFDIVGRLKALYKAYWKVFLIFIPIAFMFFRNQPVYCDDYQMCDRYEFFNIRDVMVAFLGFSNKYNFEWWFYEHYIIAMLTFPFARWVIKKNSNPVNIALIVVASILTTNLAPALGDIPVIGLFNENFLYTSFICQTQFTMGCFWMGMAMAKGNLLERLNDSMKSHKLLNPVTDILAWGLLMIFREELAYKSWDIFLVPVLIVTALDLLNRVKLIKKGFWHLGKESTNMWLTHTFYCFYFYPFAKFVTSFRWPVLCLIVLLIMSYVTALALTYFWKFIEFLYGKLLSLFCKKENA